MGMWRWGTDLCRVQWYSTVLQAVELGERHTDVDVSDVVHMRMMSGPNTTKCLTGAVWAEYPWYCIGTVPLPCCGCGGVEHDSNTGMEVTRWACCTAQHASGDADVGE